MGSFIVFASINSTHIISVYHQHLFFLRYVSRCLLNVGTTLIYSHLKWLLSPFVVFLLCMFFAEFHCKSLHGIGKLHML